VHIWCFILRLKSVTQEELDEILMARHVKLNLPALCSVLTNNLGDIRKRPFGACVSRIQPYSQWGVAGMQEFKDLNRVPEEDDVADRIMQVRACFACRPLHAGACRLCIQAAKCRGVHALQADRKFKKKQAGLGWVESSA